MKKFENMTARMRASWRTMLVSLLRVTTTVREKLHARVNKVLYR